MAMQRIPEPELMDEPEQAQAYARADFEQPHQMFIDLLLSRMGEHMQGDVLDLGCGPGDITARFAKAFPFCHLDAVDGAANMLMHARQRMEQEGLNERVNLMLACLPGDRLPVKRYDGIISNSLLHHLADPFVLWESIQEHGRSGTRIFIMDLARPESISQAQELVQQYAADEPAILQKDFYHSLLAAYRAEELEDQLRLQGLHYLQVDQVSDRHLIIYGSLL